MGSFSWCTELQKLEGNPLCPGTLLTKTPSVSSLVRALNVAVSVLGQEQGSRPRNYGNKPREQGVCRYYPKHCNLRRGGQICRRSNRLTRYCHFKEGFTLRSDGTISTKLTDGAYMFLLHQLRNLKLREIYG